MSKQPLPAPTASTVSPCPTLIQISRTPRHWKITQHHRTTRPPPTFRQQEFVRKVWPILSLAKVTFSLWSILQYGCYSSEDLKDDNISYCLPCSLKIDIYARFNISVAAFAVISASYPNMTGKPTGKPTDPAFAEVKSFRRFIFTAPV